MWHIGLCAENKPVMQRMLLHSQQKLRSVRRDLCEEKELPTSQLMGRQENLAPSSAILGCKAGWP